MDCFIFDTIDNCLNMRTNSRQFATFCKEGCKLPSFRIHFRSIDHIHAENLRIEKQIQDIAFYNSNEEGFFYSFCNQYAMLHPDFQQVDLFINQCDHDFLNTHSYAILFAYRYCLLNNNGFMIHAAAVDYHGSGILFCGDSGAGKSTQARLWKDYKNAVPINYDHPCVLREDGNFIVSGTPWSGKEGLILNQVAPIKAIVFVEQAPINRVRKMPVFEAFSNLYFHNMIYPFTREIEEMYENMIQSAAETIPVYLLQCTKSEEAVNTLSKVLFGEE